MYESIKLALLDLLKAPTEPPEAPRGKYASIKIFRASPQFLTYHLMQYSIIWIFLFIAITIISIVLLYNNLLAGALAGLLLFVLWIIVGIVGYFIVRLEYDMRYYIVTDRSLRIRKGVLQILEQTLTFANVQNIKIEQGPIERFLGISRVVVETAGGGIAMNPQTGQAGPNYHQAVLAGLEDAPGIRDLILNYLRRSPTYSGVGDPEEKTVKTAKQKTSFSQPEKQALQEILEEIRLLKTVYSK